MAAAIAAVFSAAAARTANRTADKLAAIEAQRHHAELTPKLEHSATFGRTNAYVDLRLKLVGPITLVRLDELAVSIRDDSRSRLPMVGGATAKQIAEQIWGPCMFTPQIDQADTTGRRVPPSPIERGSELKLQLQPTRPPSWSTGEWAALYEGDVIRLTIMCTLAPHSPWKLTLDVTPVDPIRVN